MHFHLALNLSDSLNSSGADEGFLRDRRMWFGVSASKSCGSLDTSVISLSFKIVSSSTRNVCYASSFKRRSPTNEYKILVMKRMSLPQTPPW